MKKNYFHSTDGLFIIAIAGIVAAVYLPFIKDLAAAGWHSVNYGVIIFLIVTILFGLVTAYYES